MTAAIAPETSSAMHGQLTTWEAVQDFIWAGNATFTLRSLKTGMRYTYKISVKKADAEAKLADSAYFLNLLSGSDNESSYRYMGLVRRPGKFFITAASKVTLKAPSVAALLWFLDKMAGKREVLGAKDGVEFWHTGRCGRCGRLLTVPESVARGIGPDCAGMGGLR